MALFMVANNLTPDDVLDSSRELAFPESVIDLFVRQARPADGGFPAKLRQRVLKGREARCVAARRKPAAGRSRPLPPRRSSEFTGQSATPRDVVTYLLYPRVYQEFIVHAAGVLRHQRAAHAGLLLRPGAAARKSAVDIEQGKTLIVKFLTVGEPAPRRHAARCSSSSTASRAKSTVQDRSRTGPSRPSSEGRPRRPRNKSPPPCPAWSSPWPSARATRWLAARSS